MIKAFYSAMGSVTDAEARCKIPAVKNIFFLQLCDSRGQKKKSLALVTHCRPNAEIS